MNHGKRIRVLIVDDHQMIRAGLRSLLKSEPGIEVVAEAEDGRTAVRLAAELSPEVVVMDINMPNLNGIDAARQMRAGERCPNVVALSAQSDRAYASQMLKAGARGFVAKEAAFEELAQAIRTVATGEVYLSPGLAIPDWAGDGGGGGG